MKKIFLLIFLSGLTFNFFGQDESVQWTFPFGGSEGGLVTEMDSDDMGNTYAVGNFDGEMIIETVNSIDTLNAGSFDDIFILKLDSLGVVQWVKQIAGYEYLVPTCVRVNSNNELIIGGSYKGNVDFDPGEDEYILQGNSNYSFAFALKLDSEGEFIWANSILTTSTTYSIALDDLNGIYLTGNFSGTNVDFDPGPSVYNLSSSGSRSIFVWKLNNDGSFDFAKEIGGSGSDTGHSIDLDTDGNILVGGVFYETVDFNPGVAVYNLTSVGEKDCFLLKLDGLGGFEWAKSFGGVEQDYLSSISVDENSDCYLTGSFSGVVDFDPNEGIEERESYNYQDDIYVLKLDNNGEFNWVNTYGNAEWDKGMSVWAKEDGFIYVSGWFVDSVDFDESPVDEYILTTEDNSSTYEHRDALILKLNLEGEFIWVKQIGGLEGDDAYYAHTDINGNLFVCGRYAETVDFGDTVATSPEYNSALFIQKMEQIPCSNFTILEDDVQALTCATNGYYSGHAVFGSEPYTYEVNQIDFGNELAFEINTTGIYTVNVSDNGLCSLTEYIQVEAPSFLYDFDLNSNLVADEFRPGFSNSVWLDAFNDACDSISGEVMMVLDSLVSFENSNIPPDSIIGDTLIWEFYDIHYGSDHLAPLLELTTSADAIIGDTVCIDLIITPISGDADSLNNIKHYCYPIVNGYDPNDKQVYPQGICGAHFTLNNEDLTYTIRFQNTGNSNAINVHIIDSLDSYLDLSTVNVISTSHEMHLEVLDGNVLDFRFDNINLPDSNSNELESHGYVIFDVSPIADDLNGVEIRNKSEIYFDFNPAVVTNTVHNTMVAILPNCSDVALNIEEEINEKDIKIYPNPNAGRFTIDLSNMDEVSISVLNLNGQLVYQRGNINAEMHQIELEGPSGMYIVQVSDNSETYHYKVIKK